MDAGAIVEGLDSAQERAVTTTSNPLCIDAGAGSGKTSVLTRRIGYRVANESVDPRRILVVTFTRRAAAELGDRLRTLGLRDAVTAGTFHGIAYQQLRALWSDRGISPPGLLERKHAFVKGLLPDGADADAADIVTEIEWAKARGVLPGDYETAVTEAGRRPPIAPDRVGEAFRRYEAAKGERRLVDFDDLLRLCCRAFSDDREFAAAQRWRFRHLFVDEYQDVNPLQFTLLRAWVGAEPDLCVVGDPNQAIYGWNGADTQHLLQFADHFPGADRVALDRNYRSTAPILELAAAALGPHRVRARAVHGDGDLPEIHEHPDERHEADGIARRVRNLRAPGDPWSAQAVLVRTHAQMSVVAQALGRAGIPNRVHRPADPRDLADGVDLVTFHAAKGLEWPVVHVAGLERGYVPIAHAQTPAAVDEERRLLYVALTRAERRLVCSWAAERSFGDYAAEREPTPWLEPMQSTLDRLDEPPAADWQKHLDDSRAHLAGTVPGRG